MPGDAQHHRPERRSIIRRNVQDWSCKRRVRSFTQKHPATKVWLAQHPQFHLRVTPASSSWLSLVERWFRELTDKNIRRGSFPSVPHLIASIDDAPLALYERTPRRDHSIPPFGPIDRRQH
jgi:hypothetical protein